MELIKIILGDIARDEAIWLSGVDSPEHLMTIDLPAGTIDHVDGFTGCTLFVIDESLGHHLFGDFHPLQLDVTIIRAGRAVLTLSKT